MVLLGLSTLEKLTWDVCENRAGRRLGKTPEMKLRLKGAGCRGNYQVGKRAGQRKQKSQLREEWSESILLTRLRSPVMSF